MNFSDPKYPKAAGIPFFGYLILVIRSSLTCYRFLCADRSRNMAPELWRSIRLPVHSGTV